MIKVSEFKDLKEYWRTTPLVLGKNHVILIGGKLFYFKRRFHSDGVKCEGVLFIENEHHESV